MVTPEQFNHETETEVDEVRADFVIINNGTIEELDQAVKAAYDYYTLYFAPNLRYHKALEERRYESK